MQVAEFDLGVVRVLVVMARLVITGERQKETCRGAIVRSTPFGRWAFASVELSMRRGTLFITDELPTVPCSEAAPNAH